MSGPPRVLHVIDHLGAGGAEWLVASLVAELGRSGAARTTLCVVTGRWADPGVVAVARSGAERVVVLERRHLYDARIAATLVRLGRRHRADVVHSQPGVGAPHARVAALALRRPHVTTLHSIPGPDMEDSAIHLLADGWSTRLSSVVVAPSPAIAEAHARRFRLDRARLRVLPNVPVALRAPAGRDHAAALRAELLDGGRGPLVVAVSRLMPAKGLDDLVAATGRLREAHPGMVLAIAGAGPEAGSLRAAAERTGAPLRLLGHRDDVPELLAAADAFCLPSRHEGVPLSLLEAMAAGLPCVATTVGGIPDVATDGRDALLVAPRSPERLAAALGRILADAGLAAQLGAAARETVERSHTIGSLAGAYGELYEGLAAAASV